MSRTLLVNAVLATSAREGAGALAIDGQRIAGIWFREETEKDDLPLYFDYSTEYDIFKSDDSNLLYDITKLSGGNLTKEEAKLSVTDEQLQHLSYQSTMIFFVLLAVVLFLVDIFIRKSEFKRKTAVQQ